MRYEYIWSIVVLLLTVAPQGAFAGEKTDLTPSIAILRAEDGVLFVELTNTTDSDVMIDMARNEQGLIPCVRLLVKATNGVIITTNAVFADGYWTPYVLESKVVPAKEYQQNLVGIPATSSVFFRVPIEPFLAIGGRDHANAKLVSPKLIYFATDGTKHEAIGRFFNIE